MTIYVENFNFNEQRDMRVRDFQFLDREKSGSDFLARKRSYLDGSMRRIIIANLGHIC